MFNQLYLDIARMRYAEMIEEAERDRRSDDALRILRAGASGRRQPRLNLAWLRRSKSRGFQHAVAPTAMTRRASL
jgi:hypothetical protein